MSRRPTGPRRPGKRLQSRARLPQFEALEGRLLLATDITISTAATSGGMFVGGVFTLTGNPATAIIQNAEIQGLLDAGTSVTIDTASAATNLGNIMVLATVAKTGGADADLILRADNTITLSGGSDVSSSSNRLNLTLNADRDASGDGAIVINSGSVITSNDGTIVLGGGTNPQTTPAAGTASDAVGIRLIGAQLTSGAGAIRLRGQGESPAGSAFQYGIAVTNNSLVQSTSGDISLDGTGGAGTSDNDGVIVLGATVTSVVGDILITGQGGDGSSNSNIGVAIANGGQVTSTGTGAQAAAITIMGTGGAGTSSNFGVSVSNATITSVDGDILITGQGGNGSGAQNVGVGFGSGGQVTSTGTAAGAATITIVGTGGTSNRNSRGVNFQFAGAMVTSVVGDILITGQGGNGSDDSNIGVAVLSDAQVTSTGTAAITIVGTGSGGTSGNYGVFVGIAGAMVTSVDGDILIAGQGGNGSGVLNIGVSIVSGGQVTSTGTGAQAAAITIMGTGGAGTIANFGVQVSNATVTAVAGDIQIIGQGGNGSGDLNIGVSIVSGGQVISTGTGAQAAAITIMGTGGAGTNSNSGVQVESTGARITSVDGDVSVTGRGQGTGIDNRGIGIFSAGIIETTGSANLTLTGTASTSVGATGRGVEIGNPGTVRATATGNVEVAGTGSGGDPDIGWDSLTIGKTGGTFAFNDMVSGTSLTVDAGAYNVVFNDGGTITGSVTLNNTGTVTLGDASLDLFTFGSLAGGIATSVTLNAQTLTTGDGSDTTFAGVISGSGGLIKQGSGTFTLTGANTYTGPTAVSAGTLSLFGDQALADSDAVNLTAAGATLDLQGDETIGSLAGVAGTAVTLNAQTLTTGDGSSTTFAGVISGSGGLVKQGGGIFTLTDLNTYTGATAITAGTLSLSGGNAIADTGAVSLTAAGAMLDLQGSETIGSLAGVTGTLVSLNAQTLATGDAGSATFAGAISGSGALTKQGSGTFTLTGPNTYTGTMTIAAGTLALGAGDVLADVSSVNVNGGTLDIGGFSDTVAAVTLISGRIAGTTGTLTSTSDFDLRNGSVDAMLGGPIGLSKTTTGTVTLSRSNAYTRTTTVVGGVLKLNAASANAIPGDLTIVGGIARLLGAGQIADAGSVVISDGTLDIQVFDDAVAGVILDGGVIVGTTGTLTSARTFDVRSGSIGAILGGGVGLIKATADTAILSGSNTYTGPTVVHAGTLLLAAAGGNAIPGDLQIGDDVGGFGTDVVRLLANNLVADTATVRVAGSGQLDLNGFTDTFALLIETVANPAEGGAGTLRGAIATANLSGGPAEINFAIAGPGPFVIRPMSALPAVTDRAIIDGASQPGFAGSPIVELDGSAAGVDANGLVITAGRSTIRGLVVNRFGGNGIVLAGEGGNVLQGNFIGTNGTGSVGLGNAANGVSILGASSQNTIGGPTSAQSNVLSGNREVGLRIAGGSMANLVLGNRIGTDPSGTQPVGNGLIGVLLLETTGNTIGGTTPEARNIISGNGSVGLRLSGGAGRNVVQGNFIGPNVAGTTALPNRFDGVFFDGGASANTIGGGNPGEGNVISGNGSVGVQIFGRGTTSNVVQGNRIGTTADGTAPLGNGTDGVFINRSSSNVIGGNIIRANDSAGIQISGPGASGNVIQGNTIGGNGFGLFLDAARGNTVGGGPGLDNIIGGNRNAEVFDTFALPAVVQEARLIDDGVMVTGIVLTFSTEMNHSRVVDLRNYRIRPTRRGLRIGISSAAYDEDARTVTLTLTRPVERDDAPRLVVNGTSRRGLTDALRRLLDGNRDGRPGGNYVTRLGPAASARTTARSVLPGRAVDHLLGTGELSAASRAAQRRVGLRRESWVSG
jgi:fibronectin-binding autotransporter adhesin